MQKKNFDQIEIGKRYIARDGKEYTCVARNPYYDEQYPNDEFVCIEKDTGTAMYVGKSGNWRASGRDSRNDLIRELRPPVRRWVNIYRHNGNLYQVGGLTQEKKRLADHVIAKYGKRVACIPIEFYEGEGLE